MSLGPGRAEVVASSEATLDLILGHPGALCQASDSEAQRVPNVIDGLAEGQRLADRDPLRIRGNVHRMHPAGVVTGRYTRLS